MNSIQRLVLINLKLGRVGSCQIVSAPCRYCVGTMLKLVGVWRALAMSMSKCDDTKKFMSLVLASEALRGSFEVLLGKPSPSKAFLGPSYGSLRFHWGPPSPSEPLIRGGNRWIDRWTDWQMKTDWGVDTRQTVKWIDDWMDEKMKRWMDQ